MIGDSMNDSDAQFLPPSSFADPMMIGGTIPFAALAFGRSFKNGLSDKDDNNRNAPKRQAGRQANPALGATTHPCHVHKQHDVFDGLRNILFYNEDIAIPREKGIGHQMGLVSGKDFSSMDLLNSLSSDISCIVDRMLSVESDFRDPVRVEQLQDQKESSVSEQDHAGLSALRCSETLEPVKTDLESLLDFPESASEDDCADNDTKVQPKEKIVEE